MTALDWVLVAVVAFSVLFAALRGFLYEAFSLAGVVFGFVIAAWGYARVAPWFLQYVKAQPIADFGAFCALFVLTTLLLSLAGEIARSAAKSAGLRPVDRVLGGAFGLLRGLLAGAVIALAVAAYVPQAMAGSLLGRHFLVGARALSWITPEDVRRQFQEGTLAIRKAAEEKLAPPSEKQK
ncbi:MAG: CvpA family protein [Candidatus Koribacter versatilis]|uniref:CvpA family protein n=1 Tax=Candidatus Korobacter versatilis TaxID=658062 RepID=A0A932EQF9_9BACT|nr:CvpA family protein [Candidatus Koribacter versatilis]